MTTVWGVPVVLDEHLAPDEWYLIDPVRTRKELTDLYNRSSGGDAEMEWRVGEETPYGERTFTLHFSRWRDTPLLLRPFAPREPLWAVQLGWLLAAYAVWKAIRRR